MNNQAAGYICTLAQAVTPSDTADNTYSYIYVGGAGNVAVVPEADSAAVTLTAVPAGSYIWLRVKRVMSTNTTATSLVGFK